MRIVGLIQFSGDYMIISFNLFRNISAETGGKTGCEAGPPLANYLTMHSRVVSKDQISHLLQGKNPCRIPPFFAVFLNPNIRRMQFDLKSPRPPEVGVSQWHRTTDTQT